MPSYFIKLNFSQRLDIHNYETRFKTKLNTVKTKSKVAEVADKCLRCDTPKLINTSSSNILDKIYTL